MCVCDSNNVLGGLWTPCQLRRFQLAVLDIWIITDTLFLLPAATTSFPDKFLVKVICVKVDLTTKNARVITHHLDQDYQFVEERIAFSRGFLELITFPKPLSQLEECVLMIYICMCSIQRISRPIKHKMFT